MEIRRLELQTDETGIQDKHSRGAVGGRPPVRFFLRLLLEKQKQLN